MSVEQYVAGILRRAPLVIVTVIIVITAAIAGRALLSSRYTAVTTLEVASPAALANEGVGVDDLEYLDRLENTYAKIAISPQVVDRVARRIGERPHVSVDAEPNTQLMRLEASASRPRVASRAANLLAETLLTTIAAQDARRFRQIDEVVDRRARTLEAEIAREQAEYDALSPAAKTGVRGLTLKTDVAAKLAVLQDQQRASESDRRARAHRAGALTIAARATPPTRTSGPSTPALVALGVIVGLIGGVGLAAGMARLDDRLQDAADVRRIATGVPVIARVPRFRGTPLYESRASAQHRAAFSDAFRRLRATIFTPDGERPSSVVVASSDAGAGRSTVAANLAIATGAAGANVVVLDADLRAPSQHQLLGVDEAPGLSEVLAESLPVHEVTRETAFRGVFVIPAGAAEIDPGELLEPAAVAEIIDQLEDSFDLVVIDTPPLSPFGDGVPVAQAATAAIVVASLGRTRRAALRTAIDELKAVRVPIFGIAINRADPPDRLVRHARRGLRVVQ
jgi:capsular exopolysaccharide synthesis family protein